MKRKILIGLLLAGMAGAADAQNASANTNPMRGTVLLQNQLIIISDCLQMYESEVEAYYTSPAFAQAGRSFPATIANSFVTTGVAAITTAPTAAAVTPQQCALYIATVTSTTSGVLTVAVNTNSDTGVTMSPLISGSTFILTPFTGTSAFAAGQAGQPTGITGWGCQYTQATTGPNLTQATVLGATNINFFTQVGGAISNCLPPGQ